MDGERLDKAGFGRLRKLTGCNLSPARNIGACCGAHGIPKKAKLTTDRFQPAENNGQPNFTAVKTRSSMTPIIFVSN
jgi:hypothetical protein